MKKALNRLIRTGSNYFMRLLLAMSFLFVSIAFSKEKPKNSGKAQQAQVTVSQVERDRIFRIKDAKLGNIIFKVSVIDEPVMSPIELTVTVKCKAPRKTVAVKKFKVCLYKGHQYDPVGQVLTINYNFGEVQESGDVLCESNDVEEIKLAKACL